MSDFLTRLAERQLGQIETIAPRVKPLYAETMPGARVASLIDETAHEPAVPAEKEGATRAPQLPEVHMESFRSVERVPEENRFALPQSSSVPGQLHEPMVRFVAEHVARELEVGRAADKDARNVTSISADIAPLRAPENMAPIAGPKLPRSETSSTPKSVPVSLDKRAQVAPVPLAHSTKPQPLQHVDRPPAPISLPQLKDPLDRADSAAEAPVHVTIGRIEVTAVTEAAPPKRTLSGRKPRLTLDQYLAGRQGRNQ